MNRPAILAAGCVSLALAPLAAYAQPDATATPAPEAAPDPRARAAYEAGVDHFKAKRYAEAIGEFTRAQRMDPSPILLFNIARAFEDWARESGEWDKYADALEYYRLYLEAAPNAPDAKAVADGLPALERLAAQAKQGREIELAVTSAPEGAAVKVDGRAVGETPLKVKLAPGKHFVTVERPGFARHSAEVALEDEPVRHAVTLVPVAAAPPPATAEASSNTAAWVVLGVGGALLLGSAITGGLALGKSTELDDIDDGNARATRSEYDALQEDGRTLAYLTDGLLLGGVAGVVTGSVMLLSGDDDAPAASPDGDGAGATHR